MVKTCHLFDHVREWKRQGKVRHMGFSFHDSAELLDQILTENPDVEFVQIVINYFDWESSFIQSRACLRSSANTARRSWSWSRSRVDAWPRCRKLPSRNSRR